MFHSFLHFRLPLWKIVVSITATLQLIQPSSADEKLATTAPLQVDTTSAQQIIPLLGVAPTFSITTLNGQMWNSPDLLGRSSLPILLLPSDSTNITPENPDALLRTLSEKADVLRAASIEPIALLTKQKVGEAPKPANNLVASHEVEKISSVFGIKGNQPTLIFIDRAGFWRRTERLTTPTKFATLLGQTPQWLPKVEVGQSAPDFSISTSDGRIFRLSDLRGKKNLLLTFFPKCFTGGCINHLTSLRDQQIQFDQNDTQILAVSVDPADGEHGQKAFAARRKLPFSLIPDTTRSLSVLYGAARSANDLAARQSILIDKKGVIRWIDRQVNVQTHGTDILAKMEELGLKK